MKRSLLNFTIVFIFAFLPNGAFGIVIHVPADQPTIQAGIEAALQGDTVLVADGTYMGEGNKNLMIDGKGLMVVSENGPAWCVIDCENSGGGLSIQNTEGLDVSISGFKFQNGNRNSGAGIYSYYSSPSVSNCIFFNNHAVGGGGVACVYSGPSFVNCLFLNNSAYHGAGLSSGAGSGPIMINNCSFIGNSIVAGGDNGGGIKCHYSVLFIENSIFCNNSALEGPQIYIGGSEEEPTTVTIAYSNVQNGQDEIYIAPFCSLVWENGMIDSDPLFIAGPYGNHYLSQVESGQSTTSPCVDSGSDYAYNICFTEASGQSCLNQASTRTDSFTDTLTVDMGFHYSGIQPTATPYPTNTPISTFSPTIAPTQTFIPTYTPASTYTPPPSFTPTSTPPMTATPTITSTSTPYPTQTSLPTNTPYPTNTIPPTITPTRLPTYTPFPTYTANPTYTPYPTPICEVFGVQIYMPRNAFTPSDDCLCEVFVCNPSHSSYQDVPIFVILEIDGLYFFAPSFSSYDFYLQDVPPGVTSLNIIPLFTWPDNVGSGRSIWYSAMTNQSITELLGELNTFEFSWS